MAASVLTGHPRGVVVARALMECGAEASAVPEASLLSVAPTPPAESAWRLKALAGRFIEIADTPASSALTVTAGLIAQAQHQGEFAAWIGSLTSIFFPPDLAASGVDLAALPFVSAGNATMAAQAADVLLRSGSFALLVLDLKGAAELSLASQTRLVGLAQKHRTALLCLTRGDRRSPAQAPRGSFVSLRMEAEKSRAGNDTFACCLRALKDKQRTPGWSQREVCRGTDGLC